MLKCKQSFKVLEEQLNHRRKIGKAVVLTGILLGAITANANTGEYSTDCQCYDFVIMTDSLSNGVLPGAIDTMPSFPGGHQAMLKYIAENIYWPYDDFCGQGKVIVKCVVNENGRLSDVEIERSVCPELDKEAIRVVKSMPRWIPGFNFGERSKFRIQIPVVFRLE